MWRRLRLAWGWEWAKVLHPEDRERVVEDWREALTAGRAPDHEMRVRGADGSYRWFLTRAVPLRDDRGAILRWYGTFTDIDARKRAEQELQKLKDQLQKENIALRDEISQTSFLDEAGELPQETQIALLRVLQERAFERVGGSQSIPVDVRVISATNRDLDMAIADGAAAALGIPRSTLESKIRSLQIDKHRFKTG